MNNKNISKTDQFKCGKCKKRECSYYELQLEVTRHYLLLV